MKFAFRPTALLLSLSLLLQTGCFSWDAVKPTELPKLNGAFTDAVQHGNLRVVTVSVADLQRPDGSLVQVKGKSDVRIVLRSGEAIDFVSPVESDVQGDEIVLRSSNRGETRFRFDTIDRAEVSQLERGKTMLAITGASFGVGLLAVLITYFAVIKPAQDSIHNNTTVP